jgi:hypothetical protein
LTQTEQQELMLLDGGMDGVLFTNGDEFFDDS